MKKLLTLLVLLTALTACTSADEEIEILPLDYFAEVDCEVEDAPKSYFTEWNEMLLEIPFCWTIQNVEEASQPLLILTDQDGEGLVTLTYDPSLPDFELQVTPLLPNDPDTQIILNSIE